MLMTGLALMLLVFVCLNATAEQPHTGFKLELTEQTPKRSFVIEYYLCEPKWLAQIWIAEKCGSTNKAVLFEYSLSGLGASVIVSDDDNWLAINYHETSGHEAPILFRRTSRIQFKQVKGIDLESIAWKAAAINKGFSSKAIFDHKYTEVLCWLGKTHSLVLRAWGHMSGEHRLGDWFCIYDVEAQKLALDMNALNQDGFHLVNSAGEDIDAKQPAGSKKLGKDR